MKIAIVCSSRRHPIYPLLERWAGKMRPVHEVALVDETRLVGGGDFLFLIACGEIVGRDVRDRFRHTLVTHASAVPQGRGWSPHIWQIIEGRNQIPVTLLEAADSVDSGAIWAERAIQLEGHELYDEMNAKLFDTILLLMDYAIEEVDRVRPRPQADDQPTYYRRRTPADSQLDPHKSIADQFELLRVADPDRFPCFVNYRGKRYVVTLRKEDES